MAQARALHGAGGRCGWCGTSLTCRGTAQVIPTGAWDHFNLRIQQQAFTISIGSRDPTMWPYRNISRNGAV